MPHYVCLDGYFTVKRLLNFVEVPIEMPSDLGGSSFYFDLCKQQEYAQKRYSFSSNRMQKSRQGISTFFWCVGEFFLPA